MVKGSKGGKGGKGDACGQKRARAAYSDTLFLMVFDPNADMQHAIIRPAMRLLCEITVGITDSCISMLIFFHICHHTSEVNGVIVPECSVDG